MKSKMKILALGVFFSAATAIATQGVSGESYDEEFAELTKSPRKLYNEAAEEIKKNSDELIALRKSDPIEAAKKSGEKEVEDAKAKYGTSSDEYADALRKYRERIWDESDRIRKAEQRLAKNAEWFLKKAQELDEAEEKAREDLKKRGIEKDEEAKLRDSEIAERTAKERRAYETAHNELKDRIRKIINFEMGRTRERRTTEVFDTLAKNVQNFLESLEKYKQAQERVRKIIEEAELIKERKEEEKPAISMQQGIRYKTVKTDEVSCDIGILYRETADGMEIEVSALPKGKGIELKNWNVTGIKLNIDGERIRPKRTDTFGTTKESAFRDAAVVVFAAIGSQYEQYADQAKSGEVCPVTGKPKGEPSKKGEIGRAIDKAGMSAGLGLLVSQAKGEITGKKSTFKLTKEEQEKIDNEDVVEISLEHQDGRLKKQVKVPLIE